MVSVRRIAIAVGLVVAAVGATLGSVMAARALREDPNCFWDDDHAITCAVWLFLLVAAIPRLRRFTAVVIAAACAVFVILILQVLGRYAPGPREIGHVAREIFVLAALAGALAGRAPLLRRSIAIVTATIVFFLLMLLPFLVVMTFGWDWTPPTWNDARHLHPLRHVYICRGVTLFDPTFHNFSYAHVGKVTSNFRGEHRPMLLLVGELREGSQWLPPEALTRMQVDDRDPALHPCEARGRHPLWPLPGETIAERLPF
jgi:hypothetical protein